MNGESIASTVDKTESIIKHNEIVYDSYGNEIKIEQKVTVTARNMKREIKALQKQLRDGKKKNILSQDEIDELEIKLEELRGEDK